MTDYRSALERLLAPIDVVRTLGPVEPVGNPVWLMADGWRVFARLAADNNSAGDEIGRFAVVGGGNLCARWDGTAGRLSLPFSLDEAYANFVSERWRGGTDQRGLAPWKLDLFYRVKGLIPRRVQLAGRRRLIRRHGLPAFPAWPLERSLSRLLDFYARCLLLSRGDRSATFRWFWPHGRRAAVALTHDVESAEGLRLALQLAGMEEEHGFRSSFNIVASWYPIDHGVVRELQDRGFEIGIHGVYHDRSMFSSRQTFLSQQPRLRAAAEEFGAQGFRSPATHRVFEWLGELPFAYDCSMPHSDPFEPQPGGCCSMWPFFIGDVVELPYTLPQDHTLFTLLGHRTAELWLTQLEAIEDEFGLVQSLTHPDRGYLADSKKRILYGEFLDRLAGRETLWSRFRATLLTGGGSATTLNSHGRSRLGGWSFLILRWRRLHSSPCRKRRLGPTIRRVGFAGLVVWFGLCLTRAVLRRRCGCGRSTRA